MEGNGEIAFVGILALVAFLCWLFQSGYPLLLLLFLLS